MRRVPLTVCFAVVAVLLLGTASPALGAAPQVKNEVATEITDTSAKLEGVVNPEGKATSYQFKFLTQAAYEANGSSFSGPEPAALLPAPPAAIGSGSSDIPVAERLTGLLPGTTYHFRLVATNLDGPTEGPPATFATYVTPSVGLPDGRAYEQVTPVDKTGNDVEGVVHLIQAASSGDAITFYVAGGIPGGSGGQALPTYLAIRGLNSWSTEGLLPPPSYGDTAKIIGETPDLSQVFIEAKLFSAGGGVAFLRRTGTGAPDKITPYAIGEKYALADASANGSTVLFEATGPPLATGAAAGLDNLYAWDSDTNTLRFAGVLPNGSPSLGGSFAGPYDWRQSDPSAGGASREYYVRPEHAVSSDGSRAFFTAGRTGQLYLRENPAKAQSPLDGGGKCTDPALACTIRVSTSKKTTGAGPGGIASNGPSPAAFMAATPDGSKAFFTSPEELTANANTGTEPPAPAIGRATLDGTTEVNQSFISTLGPWTAVDGAHVYWTNPARQSIGRANLNGTGAEEEFITGAFNPRGIAVDAGHIYWANSAEGKNNKGAIGRANLNGTGAEEEFITGASNPQGIAVDSGHIYWANAGTTAGTRKIGRANLAGGEVSQTFVTVTSAAENAGGVAVDASFIYWTLPGSNTIGRATIAGGSINQAFISGASKPLGIAVDGGHIYWANTGTGAIGRATLDGTTEVNQSFIPGLTRPRGLAVDGAHVYWGNETLSSPGNDLYAFDTASRALTDLTPDSTDANGAAVKGVLGTSENGARVYFVANGVLTSTPNVEADTAQPGTCLEAGIPSSGICNLYLWHDGTIDFIARLDASGLIGTSDVTNWLPGEKPASNAEPKSSRVSAGGGTLLFRSQRKLTAYDNHGVPEFYRYSAAGGELACVSCNPTGAPPSGAPTLQGRVAGGNIFPGRDPLALTRNLSASGGRVFFESPDKLLPTDTNGDSGCPIVAERPTCLDVYEWEADGSGSCGTPDGCLYLLSTGASSSPSFFADASVSGDDAFLFARQSLVGQDRDELQDIYDAKVGGGIPAQNGATPLPCEGEACRGEASAPPTGEAPGSAGFSGPGNETPTRHHRKKHHKKRHAKRHHRNANSTRRASR